MTKQQIVDHSLQQFLLHGIRKMTVQDIIAPMGISTKTVYKYFKGKEDLLEACLTTHYQELKSKFNQFANQDTNPLVAMANLLYGAIEQDFKVAPVFYHDLNHYYPEMQDKILAKEISFYRDYNHYAINKGIEQGLFRADINPGVVIATIDVMYRSLTRSNQYINFDLPPADLAKNTIMTYIRGICTAQGQHILDNLNQPQL